LRKGDKMKEYEVRLPVAGFVIVSVEANDETEALDKAMSSDISTDDMEEWNVYEHIVQGNVFYGPLNSYEIDEI